MGNFTIQNVVLTGISAAVPSMIRKNIDNNFFSKEDLQKFIDNTGVKEFRVANKETTTADLGLEAAEKLIAEMHIDKNEIDVLIFVSQTPDYLNIPNTAPILQHKLGLPTSCLAFDIPLGCSGFVYGLSVLGTFMQNPSFRKGLLICGDTLSKIVSQEDKSTSLLFGDCAAAAILERKNTKNSISFNMGSDGSGHKAIIINEGGSRNAMNKESLELVAYDKEIKRRGCDLSLDGMDVFSFGINQAPKSVKDLMQFASFATDDIDFAIFHQANKMMNEMIRKKLKLVPEKVPYSLEKFGNTSSASIPITLVTQVKSQLESGKKRLLLCGFGVGLSWGTCYLETENLTVLDLIEI
ncbi:ketoacyl-ACP synthase III [Flavobacterium sp. F-380]|uniref:Ketoacyl-ACP synthase III n=1 Tax=Flavobacterium kayseriense TaxID=2764714 RepID=A0ABR7J7G7_9FLAO|nr:ketoacyl-ACP synthase III [Flavobacterium kayseriense]MBC5841485.1 ketoacyl-ACP synthase III [Flavobacterium kayseriense]MBC5848013.1 ketoacyl-ACP synthase III [Flavobacterium kayseriense]